MKPQTPLSAVLAVLARVQSESRANVRRIGELQAELDRLRGRMYAQEFRRSDLPALPALPMLPPLHAPGPHEAHKKRRGDHGRPQAR